MADQKTKPHDGDVNAFIEALTDHQQRLDCHALIAMMTKVTGEKPILWGSAIIGFGSYHYRYASGHEGDAPRLAFSPRKGKISLYLVCDLDAMSGHLERLGRHARGKGCLYVKQMADINPSVLEEMMTAALGMIPKE